MELPAYMAIIVSKNGSPSAEVVNASDFAHERNLQKYIYDHPEAIPVYEVREDKRLLVAAREVRTESGPIDALAVDNDGDLYVVETKLYRNPDKRTVIAQALDYGASLWRHADFNELLSALGQAVEKQWGISFHDKLAEFFSLNDEDSDALVESMRRNLSEGNLKFVVLMDKLDDRLKDLITYVNQNSQFDIYAVQIEFYKHEEYEIVIPKLYGAEVKKDVSARTSSHQKWSEQETLDLARKGLSAETYAAFCKIFEFCKQNADSINLGRGSTRGSFGPVFAKICPRTLFTLRTNGILSFNFQGLDRPEAVIRFRQAYFEEMKETGFDLSEQDKEKFPTYTTDQWVPNTDRLIQSLKRLLQNA